MDEKIFYQGLQMIAGNFNYPITKEKMSLFWMEISLENLTDADYISAIIHLCRNREIIRPGENLVAIIIRTVETIKERSAEEAWAKVVIAIATVGSWGKPIFDDPRIVAAVEALGWKTICATENKDLNTLRAHFFRTYDSMKTRSQVQETYKVIENAGLQNLLKGIGKPIPKIPSTTSSKVEME